MNAYWIGLKGEWQAARYLKKRGMRIEGRRYRARHGEIDLIAREGDTLVFIEVKTRQNGRMGEGVQAVTRDKRARLLAAARQYLQSHPAPQVRFDVIEITSSGLRHLENAF